MCEREREEHTDPDWLQIGPSLILRESPMSAILISIPCSSDEATRKFSAFKSR